MDTVLETLVQVRPETDVQDIAGLINSLPPLVAVVVWDVVHDHVTADTIALARAATPDEYERYDVIRCMAAGNPDYPPTEEAWWLVKEMIE